ncbi:MAG: MBL fold metallo-hydrolase [Chloroflexota bacterium]
MTEAPGRLRLTVVGCAPAWARRPAHPSSSYLVELGTDGLLLDLGQGSLGALWAVRDPATLAGIVISHLHPDHHVDLVALRHQLRFGMGAARRLPLFAPAGLRERYDAFLGELDFLGGSFDGSEVTAGAWMVGPFQVEARRVLHALNSHGYRVSIAGDPAAPGLVYSGDCARWEDVAPLLRPGDTLLSEAFWGTDEPDPGAMHLTADEAARAAIAGGAARLILTHIGEETDPDAALRAAQARFPGEVLLAQPGLRLDIP